jgi:hypothetical protein
VAEDQVIPAQCEGIVMARLESPLGVESGLVELSPQARPPQGIYIARSLVQERREVPVRVLNTTHRDQKLARGSPLAHCEPVTLVTSPDLDHRQAPESSSKVQEVIEAARSNLSGGEFQELEDLITEYEDIFASGSEDYGRTDRVYHRIDMGDARTIRQPPRRLPLAKQTEVSGMLDNMQIASLIFLRCLKNKN